MKYILSAISIAACGLMVSSCSLLGGGGSSVLGNAAAGMLGNAAAGTAQTVVGALTNQNTLGNLLGSFLGGVKLDETALHGTWTYQGIDVAFDSENLLAKAGGAVAAGQIETKIDEQLTKYGIKPGSVKFTFNPDHTFAATLMGRTVNGTYTYNAETRALTMTAALGLFNQTATVGTTAKGISLLFPADKLLELLNMTSGLLGSQNSTLGAVSQLVSNYKGMKIGLEMSR